MTQTLRSSIKGALSSSIKPGLLAPAQFRGSTLDLDFAGAKSLKNQVGRKDIVTFTRASSGTYVDGDGVIRTSPVNLLLHSEDITQGQVGTNVTKSTNTTTSPDGANTADSLTETTASRSHGISPLNISFTSGVAYTFSYYFKATGVGSVRYPQLALANSSHGSAAWATFDLTNQTVGAQGGSVTAASVEDVGSGWYRCSVTATATATTTTGGFISTSDISTGTRAQSYTGDGVSGIYLWGGQVEEGTTATTYIPTTGTISGAPRFDHDPATGESLGLLIEEARTNNFTNSLFGTGWSAFNITKKSTNNLAPDGTNTAVLLGDASSTNTNSFLETSVDLVDGTPKTFTFYAKSTTTGQEAFVDYYDAGTNRTRGRINLDDGSITYDQQDGDGVITSTNAGNGWWRCQLTLTPNGTNLFSWRAGNYLTGDIYIWGAQLEANASFPTSYIPTEGTTVTRAADVAEITGVDSFYTEDVGTIYSEVDTYWSTKPSQNGCIIQLDNGSNSTGRVFHYKSGPSGNHQFQAAGADISIATPSLSYKSASGYDSSSYITCVQGVLSGTGTVSSGLSEIMVRAAIGSNFSGNHLNGHIKRLAYFPVRLPNATLQNITA